MVMNEYKTMQLETCQIRNRDENVNARSVWYNKKLLKRERKNMNTYFDLNKIESIGNM